MHEEHFFSIGKNGAKLMRFDPIAEAARKQLPKHTVIWDPTATLDFQAGTWKSGTEPENPGIGPKVACCDGVVTVHFKVQNGEFVAIDAAFHRREN
jgi:hypothetical protein